jgi:predicted Zn finger-like uncharacterized protein
LKLSCPSCRTHYNVDDRKIPATGAKLKCAKCKHVFPIGGPEASGTVPLPAPAAAQANAAIPLPGASGGAPQAEPPVPLPGAGPPSHFPPPAAAAAATPFFDAPAAPIPDDVSQSREPTSAPAPEGPVPLPGTASAEGAGNDFFSFGEADPAISEQGFSEFGEPAGDAVPLPGMASAADAPLDLPSFADAVPLPGMASAPSEPLDFSSTGEAVPLPGMASGMHPDNLTSFGEAPPSDAAGAVPLPGTASGGFFDAMPLPGSEASDALPARVEGELGWDEEATRVMRGPVPLEALRPGAPPPADGSIDNLFDVPDSAEAQTPQGEVPAFEEPPAAPASEGGDFRLPDWELPAAPEDAAPAQAVETDPFAHTFRLQGAEEPAAPSADPFQLDLSSPGEAAEATAAPAAPAASVDDVLPDFGIGLDEKPADEPPLETATLLEDLPPLEADAPPAAPSSESAAPPSAPLPAVPSFPIEPQGEYGSRMAKVAVINRPAGEAKSWKKRIPLIAAGAIAVLLLGSGFALELTPYGMFGLKKFWPARLSASSPAFAELQRAKAAILEGTHAGYTQAKDASARILGAKEYPEVRAVHCQAVFYLQRQHGAKAAGDVAAAERAVDGLLQLFPKNVEVAKAAAGRALLKGTPDQAIPLLLDAKSRAENDADIELDVLLAEAYAAKREAKRAEDTLVQAAAKARGTMKPHHALARLLAASGQEEAAADVLRKALAQNPQSHTTALLLAEVTPNVEEAKQSLEKALTAEAIAALGPAEAARAHALRGSFLWRAGQTEKAQAEFDTALKVDPSSAFARAALGRALSSQREYEKALPLFAEAQKQEPTNAEYARGFLETMLELGEVREAATEASTIYGRFPSDPDIAHLMGRINDALGKKAEAESHYKRAITAQPNMAEPRVALARMYARTARPKEAEEQLAAAASLKPQLLSLKVARGELALSQGDLSAAESSFASALADDSKSADAHLGMAQVNGKQEKWRRSYDEARKALELQPHLAGAKLQLGLASWKVGELDSAMTLLTQAAEENRRDATPLLALARVQMEKGDLPAAEQTLLGLTTSELASPEAYFQLAQVRLKRSSYVAAIEAMRSALSGNPNEATYHHQLGLIYAAARKPSDAVEEWKKTLELDPNAADTLEALGLLYLERSDMANATQYLERAAKVAPNRGRLFVAIGDAYYQAGKWDLAISNYQQALKVDASLDKVNFKLARTYSEQGNVIEAIRHYQRELAVEPQNAMAHYFLGFAFKERGRRRDAIASFRAYLANKPDAADKREIEDEIYDLQQNY